MKIISLLPAATEIVCALGLESCLVGRSHECDFPETVKVLPVCSSAKIIAGSDSAEIDRQVKELLSDAISIYEVDKELIRQLNPDIIITQAQCEVCAVSLTDVEAAVSGLLGKKCKVISLSPQTFSDILESIQHVADELGETERGLELVEQYTERKDLIRHKLKFISSRPTVACIEWLSPLMIAGNWTPELVEVAGGVPVLARSGEHSPFIEFSQLRAADPEMLVIMPCGYTIQQTMQEIGFLLGLEGWEELKAVKLNQVYIADGNHYFNRSGPRIIDSCEMLAEIIQPKQFIFGYEGRGWIRFHV